MSAVAGAPPIAPGRGAAPPTEKHAMSRGKKILLSVVALWLGGIVFFVAVYGFKGHKVAEVASGAFSPVDEFKLETWFKAGPIAFNKGVLYLLITAAITIGIMGYIARRLKERPNRLQVAVEWFYDFTRQMTRENLDASMERKYFPLIATIFVFILVTNLFGYIPLPVNSGQTFNIFGAHIPSLQIYATDTNLAFPLTLALSVFVLFTYEGVRHHGAIGYIKSLMPPGLEGRFKRAAILGLEILSNFLRLISLTVRLWANLLAGHLLIAFMGGELGVLVGDQWVSWFLLPAGIAIYLFEAVLIAGLQAFIFAILTAIYLGGAVESH
ncbi:MAG TPA: F0F1 ATP synthase subunit A [Solirubrobacteraceae bacterium]|jgi:F-type H+-transporting ATPase subunit a|nr:F0F1 ATP synthase subunit A [Solirubrobacteraceae bacterium]